MQSASLTSSSLPVGRLSKADLLVALFVLSVIGLLASATDLRAAEGVAPAEPVQHFDIWEYRVLGNTVLDAEKLESALYPLLGAGQTLENVNAARSTVEKLYQDRGYQTVFVDIPEQDVAGGVVRLQVTEGRLERTRITGARYFSNGAIRAALPEAKAGEVPNILQLQSELTALNVETADRRVTPVLRAGSRPGTVNLALNVEDELPVHFSIEANNQYTANTSELRLAAALSYDNVFGRLDSFGIQYQTAPEEPSEMGVLVGSYAMNLGDGGNRLAFFYADSDSDVATVGALSVLGRGTIMGGRLIMPVASGAASTHSITLGTDYKDFKESILVDAASSLVTPITYVNLSAGHASTWRMGGTMILVEETVNFGIRGVGNNAHEFENKRFLARPNYFYLRSSGRLVQQLTDNGFSVELGLSGQYAVEPVISNEQFAVGGAGGVRGYLEAEELGDVGLKSTLQLNLPVFRTAGGGFEAQTFVFGDYGVVSTLKPLPGESNKADLGSAGAGFTLSVFNWLNASLTWAYPLMDGVHTLNGDSRLHFLLRAAW